MVKAFILLFVLSNIAGAAYLPLTPVVNGGTGVATLTNHGVVIGQGTVPVVVTAAGSTGQVLTSNGASLDPTFQTLSASTTTYAWSGYHNASNCSFPRSSATLGNPTIDASCTLTELQNSNFGTVTSYNDGTPGNNLPGIVFTCPAIGYYFIQAQMASIDNGASSDEFTLGDTTGPTIIGAGYVSSVLALNDRFISTISGTYFCSSISSRTIRIQSASSATTVTIEGAGTQNQAVNWQIFLIH